GDASSPAENVQVHGHVAPSEHREVLAAEHLLDDGGGAAECVVLAREEEGADGERLAGRERQSVTRRLAVEQRGGDLGEQTRPVARAVRGRGATMGHPGQRLQREARDVGGALSGRARDEPYAAGIVLPPGVQVPRAAVGPTRSVGCGHSCLLVTPGQQNGPLDWERAGGLL